MNLSLGVTNKGALQFFFEHLEDVTEDSDPPKSELLYNASVLAHFALTSTDAADAFPACPRSLETIFDLYVMDRIALHNDPEILEAAASQCLFLSGFFQDQQKHRYPISWYAGIGTDFYLRASRASRDRSHSRMMLTMARRFPFWRERQAVLAREFRERPFLIRLG